MNERDEKVLAYLEVKNDWTKPTEIGMEVFGAYYSQASSRAGDPLKRLVSAGLVERSGKGHYRIKRGNGA